MRRPSVPIGVMSRVCTLEHATIVTEHIMPDFEVARSLLHSIGWDQVQLHAVPGGTVNTTYLVANRGRQWYLRIAPTEGQANAGPTWFTSRNLQRELRAVTIWSDHQHLLPKTVYSDFTRTLFPADWVIQEAIPGDSWEAQRARFTPTETRALWRQLGQLSAELHAYVGTEFGPPEQGTGTRRWSEFVRWDAAGLMLDARRYQLSLTPFATLCDLVDRSVHELDEVSQPRLIHSDLGMRHVMVARDEHGTPRITGLIDMEYARFADAYSESIFVDEALKPQRDPMFDEFLDAYGADRADRSFRLRSLIYQLIAMAWWATDAMRRERPSEARDVLNAMIARLDEDKRIR